MNDFFHILNNDFLKNIKIRDDESNINISSLRFIKDKEEIDEIIYKTSYKYLNEKEIKILKTFNDSMLNYNDDLNLNYLKSVIENLLKSSYDDIFVYCIKNKIFGIFSIDLIKYESKNFIFINQGKNNISNISLYRDEKFKLKYQEIIKDILSLFIKVDDSIVKKIVDYEIKILDSRLSNTDRRDILNIFNKIKITDFKFKNFNFSKILYALLGDLKYPNLEILSEDTHDTKFYQFIDSLLVEPDFKYYIIWCIILESSLVSFEKLNDKIFELIKIIKGIKKKMSKDKKIFHLNNLFLGHLISKEYFINIEPTVKINIKKYIKYLMNSFRDRLQNNKWMDQLTKNDAIIKLDNIKINVYDTKFIDFNNLPYLTNIYYENIKLINEYTFNETFKIKLNNDKIFNTNIYSINAFYDPTNNEIIFPFGILRPPYYYNDFNPININKIAYNFGAIGSVIGHEIIHGFDDQGRLFDKEGRLNNWWKPESEKKYVELSNKIANLYSKHNINSKLTMGENIADIGGVRISLSALQMYLLDNKLILNDEILTNFIKGWTFIWRGKSTKEEYKIRILNDPHSPIIQRVNIPLNNLKEIENNKVDDIIEIW
jgi:predicted metalloendopeptidase